MPDRAAFSRRLLPAAAALMVVGGAHAQTTGGDAAALAALMERYAAALRAGDIEALVALYTPNGVFMREDLPAAVGSDALRTAYRDAFAALKVDLAFQIQDAEISGDMAWLRSTSRGRVKVLATGAEMEQSYNQLIVFRRIDGAWKVRSYLYASNRPAPAAATR